MCSLTGECVLLLENVFSYWRMCRLYIDMSMGARAHLCCVQAKLAAKRLHVSPFPITAARPCARIHQYDAPAGFAKILKCAAARQRRAVARDGAHVFNALINDGGCLCEECCIFYGLLFSMDVDGELRRLLEDRGEAPPNSSIWQPD